MTSSIYHKFIKAFFSLAVLFFIGFAILYYLAFSAPLYNQDSVNVTIEPGQSLRSIANELKESKVLRSAGAGQALMVFFGGERNIKAGIYVFKNPENAIKVARRIVQGDYGYIPTKLTVPEGSDSKKIAELVNAKFPFIPASTVLAEAKSKEGYLFPETYFFAPMANLDSIIKRMSATFNMMIKPYEQEIKKSGRSTEDIIKIASILEAEVQSDSDRKMVADLLWRRLNNNMLLQVDSTLGYVLDKTSAQLNLSDLRTDNLYNTYVYKGLPPTPISNPGIKSIEAALRPASNNFFFYLSDKNGITHFAKTYAEHIANKKKYLK